MKNEVHIGDYKKQKELLARKISQKILRGENASVCIITKYENIKQQLFDEIIDCVDNDYIALHKATDDTLIVTYKEQESVIHISTSLSNDVIKNVLLYNDFIFFNADINSDDDFEILSCLARIVSYMNLTPIKFYVDRVRVEGDNLIVSDRTLPLRDTQTSLNF